MPGTVTALPRRTEQPALFAGGKPTPLLLLGLSMLDTLGDLDAEQAAIYRATSREIERRNPNVRQLLLDDLRAQAAAGDCTPRTGAQRLAAALKRLTDVA